MADLKFYSWQREGLGNAIQGVAASGRPEIGLSVTVNSAVAEKRFPIVGPGDVIGFSADMVIRTEPVHWNTNFPPKLLAHIEFYDEDFPWRYSPDKANNGTSKLDPWLALIVLKEDEFTTEGQKTIPLPTILLKKELTDYSLSNNHLWAHVQELQTADPKHPDRIISRLICPRPLEPNTPYHAFVVPVYENGRLAGLGKEDKDIKAPATEFAWGPATPAKPAMPIDGLLPVYYQWYFHTGNNEDFEYLADLLEVRDLEAMVGRKKMDCSEPGFGIPTNPIRMTYLEGALKTLNEDISPNLAGFEGELKIMLNDGVKNNGDPVVTPPFYGQKHINAPSLEPTVETWIHQLNRDPANRAAAGLGVQVFRKYQDHYMQKAWEQLESIVEANKTIQTAVGTLAVSQSMYEKYFEPYENPLKPLLGPKNEMRELYASMALLAPIHVKLRSGTKTSTDVKEEGTLQYLLPKSNQNASMYGVAFRRATRKNGPFRKKLERNRVEAIDFDNLLLKQEENNDLAIGGDIHSQFTGRQELVDIAGYDGFNEMINRVTTEPNESNDTWITWRESIEPRTTIRDTLDKMMAMPVANWFGDPDNIKPALAYPDFEDPMYLKLIELSTEFLMPNLHLIPNNTVAVLLSNQAFIESFMVGLNVAMCSEMRWREYPTDERGTCFRQFWDRKGLLTEAEKAVKTAPYKDIKPIDTWQNKLGDHANRKGTDKLVLALRGDLFKCFPNTSIYAIRAEEDNQKNLVLKMPNATTHEIAETDIKFPAFKAEVGADVKLLGFDLTEAEAKGTGTGTDLGWFFILQETPGETRFGIPIPTTPSSSADMASKLYQPPVMIAIPANEMLK